jgi:signal transduction histidine kinase
VTVGQRLVDHLPAPLRSVRFRIAFTYALFLFVVGAALLGAINPGLNRALAEDAVSRDAARHGRYEDQTGRMRSVSPSEFPDLQAFESNVNRYALRVLGQYSFIALGGLAVLSFGVGWYVSGRVLRPINRIASAARQIEATDLSRRIDLAGPRDELRSLADTFDALLSRLEAAFRRERQFIADASHELRNPLTVVRANIEGIEQRERSDPRELARQVAALRRATDRMASVVDDLMIVARAQSPSAEFADVDVESLLVELRDEYAPVAADRKLSIEVATAPRLAVRGDRISLERAVSNLVDNALRFAPEGSAVKLVAGRSADWAWVAVEDRGPGIASDDMELIFTRQWRRESRSGKAVAGNAGTGHAKPAAGAGLGLAIVRQVAEAHGGRAKVYSQPGRGAAFVIWLPGAMTSFAPGAATG